MLQYAYMHLSPNVYRLSVFLLQNSERHKSHMKDEIFFQHRVDIYVSAMVDKDRIDVHINA
jgi:hypothetical protein